MPRGAPRKPDPTIPGHIDQAKIPAGLYWDRSGNGRWYVRTRDADGRIRTKAVANRAARLSDLHAIAEARNGGPRRGTLGHLMAAFHDSTECRALAPGTRRDYAWCRAVVTAIKTPHGTWDQLEVDRLDVPNVQRLVESLAKGTEGREPTPAKANHVLRYLRRLCAWGIRHGECTTNPATGARQALERRQHSMPTHAAYEAVATYARAGGALTPHSKGSCPPYLAPIMELAYLCRLRGIEAAGLTDAHATTEGVRASRVKGSLDNVTRWNPRLRAAWDDAVRIRTAILAKPKNRARPVPLRPEDRALFVSEDGTPLPKAALDTAWQNLMRRAIAEDVIDGSERFTLHGLKHRGVTDTKGTRADKKDASGHRTDAMLDRYNHALPLVEAAAAPDFSGEFSGGSRKGPRLAPKSLF